MLGGSVTGGYGGALIATKMSQIAQSLIGTKSIYMQRGSQALTPFHIDDTVYISPLDNAGVNTTTWAEDVKVRFSMPKTSTLIGKAWVEWDMSAGTNDGYVPAVPAVTGAYTQRAAVPAVGTPTAAYAKNIGDIFWKTQILRYGSNVLQQYDTDFIPMFRRLCKNDVNIEDVNANVLGGLPPGGAGEQVLIDAFYTGVKLRCPLEELFWQSNQDEYWMPESLALEGELILITRAPGQCIYTNDGAAPATTPSFSGVSLRYQEITLSAAEKENRLKLYKSPEGHVIHFLDLEQQPGYTGNGTGTTQPTYNALNQPVWTSLSLPVPLSNFRMDMAEIIFCVRLATAAPNTSLSPTANLSGSLTNWCGSRLESNTQASIVTGNSIATVVPVVQFKLQAAGKDIFVYQPDLWNRSHVRKYYHPDSQIADGFYCIPFARYPEDRKNATGHQSASVLGQLVLMIDVPNYGSTYTYQVDVWSHSHNLIQSRAGGIAKALH